MHQEVLPSAGYQPSLGAAVVNRMRGADTGVQKTRDFLELPVQFLVHGVFSPAKHINMDLMASFSTHNKYTTVEGYVRFRHTLALIRQKDAACLDVRSAAEYKKKILEMAAFIGYSQSSYSKFLRRRDGWLRLEGRIPEKYFRFISIKPAVLDFTLQLNQEEFEYALHLPVYPRNFIIRYMPAVYGPKELPAGTTEQEAIALIQAFQEGHKFRCCINIHQIKTIFVEPGRGYSTVIFSPRLKHTADGFYVASDDGVGTGMTR